MRLCALEHAVCQAHALIYATNQYSIATVEKTQRMALEHLSRLAFPQLPPEWSDHYLAELEAATCRLHGMTRLFLVRKE
jgi:hypothetical protein